VIISFAAFHSDPPNFNNFLKLKIMYKITTIIWQLLTFILMFMSNSLLSQINIPYNQPCGNSEFEPVYSDEFNFLDLNKWKIDDQTDHWADEYPSIVEPTCCLSKNVNVINGALKIDMIKEQYLSTDINKINHYWCSAQAQHQNDPNWHYNYTGGQVLSLCPYNSDFGYYEAKISFPSDSFHNVQMAQTRLKLTSWNL